MASSIEKPVYKLTICSETYIYAHRIWHIALQTQHNMHTLTSGQFNVLNKPFIYDKNILYELLGIHVNWRTYVFDCVVVVICAEAKK